MCECVCEAEAGRCAPLVADLRNQGASVSVSEARAPTGIPTSSFVSRWHKAAAETAADCRHRPRASSSRGVAPRSPPRPGDGDKVGFLARAEPSFSICKFSPD